MHVMTHETLLDSFQGSRMAWGLIKVNESIEPAGSGTRHVLGGFRVRYVAKDGTTGGRFFTEETHAREMWASLKERG